MAIDHPFYFLRHGETHWNRERRHQGQLDIKLNDLGRAQAARAAEALRGQPVTRIVTSPLSRAHDTARVVAKLLGVEVMLDPGLMECHQGDHQGEPIGPWLPRYFEGSYVPSNGEPFDDCCTRTWAAMRRAVALGPNTLIVAHGGSWVSARRYVSVDPDRSWIPNAMPLHIVPDGTVWRSSIIGEGSWDDALAVQAP